MESAELPVSKSFRVIYDHLGSDVVDIYTITAVLWRGPNSTWLQQLIRSVVSFFTQTHIPPIVLYNIITQLKKDACPNESDWEDKAVSCIISLYLCIFLARKWIPFLYGLTKNTRLKDTTNEEHGSISVLMHKGSNLYISESIYVLGIFSNLLSLCLNTLTCLAIMLQTHGAINIVVGVFSMHYIHSVPQSLVNNALKSQAKQVLEKSFRDTTPTAISSITATFSTWIGFMGFVVMIVLFPLFGTLIILLTAASVIYMPICK